MSTAKVDAKKRIVLPTGKPGKVYDVQEQAEGRVILVRLERPTATREMSREACLDAMRKALLRLAMTWNEIKCLTRDP